MVKKYPKIQRKLDLIERVYAEIKEIQGTCTHEGLSGKYGGNTGNYCRDDDSYWVDFKCPECGKSWTEDQGDVGYRKYTDGKSYLTSKEGFRFLKESR